VPGKLVTRGDRAQYTKANHIALQRVLSGEMEFLDAHGYWWYGPPFFMTEADINRARRLRDMRSI